MEGTKKIIIVVLFSFLFFFIAPPPSEALRSPFLVLPLNEYRLITQYVFDNFSIEHGFPTYQKGTYKHGGTDYDAEHDGSTKVYAAYGGKVVEAVNTRPDKANLVLTQGFGNYIVIETSDKNQTVYGHFKEGGVKVSIGDTVSQGQFLGYAGNSGTCIGTSDVDQKYDDQGNPMYDKSGNPILVYSFYHLHFEINENTVDGRWMYGEPVLNPYDTDKGCLFLGGCERPKLADGSGGDDNPEPPTPTYIQDYPFQKDGFLNAHSSESFDSNPEITHLASGKFSSFTRSGLFVTTKDDDHLYYYHRYRSGRFSDILTKQFFIDGKEEANPEITAVTTGTFYSRQEYLAVNFDHEKKVYFYDKTRVLGYVDLPSDSSYTVKNILSGDFDGDRKDELLVILSDNDRILMLDNFRRPTRRILSPDPNQGTIMEYTGSFDPYPGKSAIDLSSDYTHSRWWKDQLLLSEKDQSWIDLFEYSGNSFTKTANTKLPEKKYHDLTTADFDRDQEDEIAIADSEDDTVSIFDYCKDCSGNERFTFAGKLDAHGGSPKITKITSGDFDGDRNSELGIATSSDDHVYFYKYKENLGGSGSIPSIHYLSGDQSTQPWYEEFTNSSHPRFRWYLDFPYDENSYYNIQVKGVSNKARFSYRLDYQEALNENDTFEIPDTLSEGEYEFSIQLQHRKNRRERSNTAVLNFVIDQSPPENIEATLLNLEDDPKETFELKIIGEDASKIEAIKIANTANPADEKIFESYPYHPFENLIYENVHSEINDLSIKLADVFGNLSDEITLSIDAGDLFKDPIVFAEPGRTYTKDDDIDGNLTNGIQVNITGASEKNSTILFMLAENMYETISDEDGNFSASVTLSFDQGQDPDGQRLECENVIQASYENEKDIYESNFFLLSGPTIKGGVLSQDETWSICGSPYLTSGNITIPEDIKLTIEQGTIVEIKYQTYQLGIIVDRGELDINGEEEKKVIITSSRDSIYPDNDTIDPPNRGDIFGIRFQNQAVGRIQGLSIAYGGKWVNASTADIVIEDSDVEISDSVIEKSYSHGIQIEKNSKASIQRTDIFENFGQGVRIVDSDDVSVTGSNITKNTGGIGIKSANPTIKNNTFSENTTAAIIAGYGSFPEISDNLYENNDLNGVLLSGVYESSGTLPIEDVLVINSSVTVNEEVDLTLLPGSIIKFLPKSKMSIKGKLLAEGTNEKKIYFTSVADDSIGGDTNNDGNATSPNQGDWGFLEFLNASGKSTIDHAKISYGGYGYFGSLQKIANIGVWNSELSIRNSEIDHSIMHGISAYTGGSVFFANLSFLENAGVDLYDAGGNFVEE